MPRALDLTGQKSGRLTAIKFIGHRGDKRIWFCKCECGNESQVETGAFTKGKTISCGCYNSEQVSRMLVKRNTTHNKSSSRVYTIWHDMMRRCYDDRVLGYESYGAVGIRTSESWFSFENFYNDMGDPPSKGHSLDRIDNTKGYSKENCRWATAIQQANNRSSNKILEINGRKLTMAEASKEFGISYTTLRARLRRGWSDIDAISRPV